jgi:hypothetical protein
MKPSPWFESDKVEKKQCKGSKNCDPDKCITVIMDDCRFFCSKQEKDKDKEDNYE